MGSDPPIIIDTGGSVRIEFPSSIFTPDPATGKHKNADKEIKQVEVTVNGTTAFDSKNLSGKDVVITIRYGNP